MHEKIIIKSWADTRYYSNRMDDNDSYAFILEALKRMLLLPNKESYHFEFDLRYPYDDWEFANVQSIFHRNDLNIHLNSVTRKYIYTMLNCFFDRLKKEECELYITNVLANEFKNKNYSVKTLQTKCPIEFSKNSKKYSLIHKGKILYLIPKDIGTRVFNKIQNTKLWSFL